MNTLNPHATLSPIPIKMLSIVSIALALLL
jgi:hypothetical protein